VNRQYSLDCELVLANRHAVDELDRTPQSVELCALVYVHDAITRSAAIPRWVLQVCLEPRQHDLEHRQAAAEALPGEQVSLAGDVGLLQRGSLQIRWLFDILQKSDGYV